MHIPTDTAYAVYASLVVLCVLGSVFGVFKEILRKIMDALGL